MRKRLLTAHPSAGLSREQIQRGPVLAALSGEYEQAASKPRQDWLAEFWNRAPLPGAVLSMSPWFDMELKNESIEANASVDKMLSRDLLCGFSDSMLDGTGIAITDPRINLAYADPTGLPPTMIYYGGYEILTDDANQFAGRARAAGVDLELRSLPEGQHNFFLGAGRVPEIDAAVAEMGAWLRSKIGLTLSTA